MPTLRFDELTRDELKALAPRATVVVPIGSTEQHGPHLPVCVDAAIVSAIAQRAVEQASQHVPLTLAPTLPFGFAHHHLPFGGTISIGLSTYLDVLTGIGRSLAAGGFRRIVFLNGHGGNESPMRAALDRLVFEDGLDLHVAGTSYWTCASDTLADLNLDGPVPGHAGGFETSCLSALLPYLVRTDRVPPPEAEPQPLVRQRIDGALIRRAGLWETSDGRTDDSRTASGETGERILRAVSERVGRFLIEFHASTGSHQDDVPLPSADDE